MWRRFSSCIFLTEETPENSLSKGLPMSHAKELFLDHAATTPLHPDALGAMLPYFGNHFGLPASFSDLRSRTKRGMDEARSQVACLINARPQEIVFTSGGTESNNLAILGTIYAKGSKGSHIITSSIEHPSVLHTCRHLEREGFRVTCVPVDNQGRVDPESVKEAICKDTLLISIMHANHGVGTLQPIKEIGAAAHAKGIAFHVDAAQSAGKIPINVEELPIDLLTLSSHKLYGPKGVGALYVRNSAEIIPVFSGSGEEKGLRPGTPNIPGIVAFGVACSVAQRDLENNRILMTSLRESLEQQITSRITGAMIHGFDAPRLPHILCVSFEGVTGDSMSACLDSMDIVVSSGSSLKDYGEDFSYVLEAMHVDLHNTCDAVRLSLGWENKEKEIRHMAACLEKAVSRIREFSRVSQGRELSIFTFPDRKDVLSAIETLKGNSFPFIPCVKPNDIVYAVHSPLALACMTRDQENIGGILGDNGINILGLRNVITCCRTIEKKEQEFWNKVEQIKKGKF